jgi:hypothetical protein
VPTWRPPHTDSAARSGSCAPRHALEFSPGLRRRGQRLGFRIQGSGSRAQGSGSRVQGLRSRVWGLGFEV